METKQDIGVYTDIEKGYRTALIKFSDNIYFKVGQYSKDSEPSDYNYYFSLSCFSMNLTTNVLFVINK